MKIIYKDKELIPFVTLSHGECFMTQKRGCIFMKTEYNSNTNYVCLEDGSTGYMQDADDVYKANCQVIVEE